MKKKSRLIGVLNIGSHAIRLYIAQFPRSGSVKILDQLWIPIALGKDVFGKGLITNGSIKELIHILRNFLEVMHSYQVDTYKAFATSTLAEAINIDVVFERIHNQTSIHIELLEPIQLTESLYLAVQKRVKERFGFLKDKVLILSVGGGATQVVLQKEGRVLFVETQHQGTLRLIRNLDLPEQFLNSTLRPIAQNFFAALKRTYDIFGIERFIALNDDLLQLVQNIKSFKQTNGVYRIQRQRFEEIYERFYTTDLVKLKKKYNINENVAETTKIAVLMVGIYFQMTDAKEILVPEVNLSVALLDRLSLGENQTLVFEKDEAIQKHILSAALTIGQKYHFEEDHELHVLKIARRLFDQFQPVFGFSKEERIYLEVASLLHDIGSFVNASSHHKHSARLISACQILGLSGREIQLIAQISRYHRRAIPKASHSEYMALSVPDRLIVSRQAALLRLADALDNFHNRVVKDVEVDMSDEECVLRVGLKADRFNYIDLVKSAVQKKADLFQNFFGISVKVEIAL